MSTLYLHMKTRPRNAHRMSELFSYTRSRKTPSAVNTRVQTRTLMEATFSSSYTLITFAMKVMQLTRMTTFIMSRRMKQGDAMLISSGLDHYPPCLWGFNTPLEAPFFSATILCVLDAGSAPGMQGEKILQPGVVGGQLRVLLQTPSVKTSCNVSAITSIPSG